MQMAGQPQANANFNANVPTMQPLVIDEDMKRDKAYQYCGYPAFSKWMASSNDFFILRRYSALAARSLLYLQHSIAKIEQELEQLDTQSMYAPDGYAGIDTIDYDTQPDRSMLIQKLTPLLQKYYDLVNAYRQIKAVPTASQHQYENVDNWLATYDQAIRPEEQHFRNRAGDLFPMKAFPRSPVGRLLERASWLRSRFQPLLGTEKIVSDYTSYHSDTALEYFISAMILIIGLGLLLGPMWWLSYVSYDSYRLAIISVSVTIFTIWLWLSAGQRPFEILAGTAAYAAVLMVYLQVQKGSDGKAR